MAAAKKVATKTAKKPATKTSIAKKSTAKRAPAKRTAAKKTLASKKTAASKKVAATRKSAKAKQTAAESKVNDLFDNFQDKAEQAKSNGKKAGLAYLGLYGKAYDFAKEQYAKAVSERESRFEALVKRGESVQHKAQSRIDDIELPEFEMPSVSMSDMTAKNAKKVIQDGVDKVKQGVESAKEKTEEFVEVASAGFEELKDRVSPAKA